MSESNGSDQDTALEARVSALERMVVRQGNIILRVAEGARQSDENVKRVLEVVQRQARATEEVVAHVETFMRETYLKASDAAKSAGRAADHTGEIALVVEGAVAMGKHNKWAGAIVAFRTLPWRSQLILGLIVGSALIIYLVHVLG